MYGRSPVEIAEDAILSVQELAQSKMVSREQATRLCIDISRNKKYADIIAQGDTLIEQQGEVDTNKWLDDVQRYAYYLYSM